VFERPDSGELAVLVHIDFYNETNREDLSEFKELVVSAGVEPLAIVSGSRDTPDPKYFIGKGKLEEVKFELEHAHADVVLFNHALSPSQQRNLEGFLQARVIDRTGLILDIFAQRARTHEGKLQVELAQLEYMSTRLIRGWTHLERQKGGIGLRGPGETQLETDRRLLRARIKAITARLEKVRKQRDQGRRARQRSEIPTVSLVGYTNAGKSTLFNRLTHARVYAADQLFATLDPTLRYVELPVVGKVVLADTVGFIRHLPHKLVDAFRATLEETQNADLLLHVIDASDEKRLDNIEQVQAVLEEIGVSDIPVLKVYNKLDLIPGRQARIDYDDRQMPVSVYLSSVTGEGVELLERAISELLAKSVYSGCWRLLPQCVAKHAKLRSILYAQGAVSNESFDESGNILIEVVIPRVDLDILLSRAQLSLSELEGQAHS